MINVIFNQLLATSMVFNGSNYGLSIGTGGCPKLLLWVVRINFSAMCTVDELIIFLQIFEFYAMYILIEAQKDKRIEEIYFEHNIENISEKLSDNNT